MKIVHFHMGKEGGAEKFFVHLAHAFAERGAEQKAFIRPNRTWRDAVARVAEIHEGNFRRVSVERFFLMSRVNHLINQFKPDALMAWMPRGSRMVPDYRDAVRVARLGDYPEKLDAFTNIDILVGNTPGIVECCHNLGWNGRLEVVSNFTTVSDAPAIAKAELNTPEEAFVVVGAGRFVGRKGFDTLIRAVARLDGVYLWLVGDGQERENLERLARREGIIERLRFVGWQKDTVPFLRAADLCCMPSKHEPLGNVALEAWGVGVPVVSTRSEGPSWYMTDRKDGLMADIGDDEGIASAIAEIRSDKELAKRLVENGRASLDHRFSKRAIVDAYWRLFSGW